MNKLPFKLSSIRWDAHGCPPFTVGTDLSFLDRYKQSGVDFISLNVGFDLTTQETTIKLIDYIHRWVSENNEKYSIVRTTQEIEENKARNKLSIAFDIEGCHLLNGEIDMIAKLYALGVKQMLFCYNTNNLAGGGCLGEDISLTHFGKQLVSACNNVGIVIDCSHTGYKTSLDIIDLSIQPVVFSHSNPKSLVNHPRNISDDQIIACAKRGGVIGINGIGIFLGDNNTSTERMVEHIDYVAQLVGSEHVGIGMDCVFNQDEVKSIAENNPETFPTSLGFSDVRIAEPEQFTELSELLDKRGYTDKDINQILGDNFLRVAKTVWR